MFPDYVEARCAGIVQERPAIDPRRQDVVQDESNRAAGAASSDAHGVAVGRHDRNSDSALVSPSLCVYGLDEERHRLSVPRKRRDAGPARHRLDDLERAMCALPLHVRREHLLPRSACLSFLSTRFLAHRTFKKH